MKKIVVIGSRDSGSKNNSEIIAKNIATDSTVVQSVYWEDLLLRIRGGVVEVTAHGEDVFDQADLVLAFGWYKNGAKSIYRDLAFALALYLKSQNIRFWNNEMIQQRSITKLSCMVQLALEGVSVPDTEFCLEYTEDLIQAERTFPLVVKAVAASRGESNFLVNDQAELSEVLGREGRFMIQGYLPNDHDLRVICFGGTPSLVLRRSRGEDADTHLNNTSQGGQAVWLEGADIPDGILTLSQRICMIMGREMAGVDLIPDDSSETGYSCLEVNAIPQLTSGHDTDIKMKMLRHIVTGE